MGVEKTAPGSKMQNPYHLPVFERNTGFREEGHEFQVFFCSVLPSSDNYLFLSKSPCRLQEKKGHITALSFSVY